MAERISSTRLALYCLGSTGFLLAERTVANVALYFYLPPSGRGLSAQVPQHVFFGGLTAFGLVMLIGRTADARSPSIAAVIAGRVGAHSSRARSLTVPCPLSEHASR